MRVQLAHAIPGRIRLKVPEIRDNSEAAAEMQRRLSELGEVRRVEVNRSSSSVIVFYEVSPMAGILEKLESLFGGFRSAPRATRELSNGKPAESIASLFARVEENLEDSTGVGLKLLIPAWFTAFGLFSLMRAVSRKSVPLPSWYELLWFAFNTFIVLNLPLPEHDKKTE